MKRQYLLALLMLCSVSGWARETTHQQWASDIAAFRRADRLKPPPAGSVLFVGSSSIRFWKSLAADFPEVHTINRGFGGSELDDVTYYADRIVTPYHSRAIVVYAGDNDLQFGDSPDQVLADFTHFVNTVRKRLPEVPIAFIAIKPSVAREALLAKIRQANTLIAAYASSQANVSYLDIYTPMLGGACRPRNDWFSSDGLHMNRKGYQLWTRVVRHWLDGLGAKKS